MKKTEMKVSFSINGKFVPDDINSILQIEPSKTVKIGDPRLGKRFAKNGTWELNTEYIETVDLADLLIKVIVDTRLNTKLDKLLYIKKNDDDVMMRLDVCINISRNEKPVIWIAPIISKFVADLGIYIDIDTYYEL